MHEINFESKTVSWLLKFTDKHLNPNAFEKMSFKLAAQLLNNTTAAALKVAVRSGELLSIIAESMAFLAKTVNDLFDALSRILCDKKYRRL